MTEPKKFEHDDQPMMTRVRLLYLDQLLLRPDLDGLHLLGRLGLNAVSVQKHLQSTETHKHTYKN